MRASALLCDEDAAEDAAAIAAVDTNLAFMEDDPGER
jgi:hypothetical protein